MFCKYDKGDPNLRPCLADGKTATFHRWVEGDEGLLQFDCYMKPEEVVRVNREFLRTGVSGAGTHIEKLRTCFALVEYADGSVGKVKPELIQFLDRKEG